MNEVKRITIVFPVDLWRQLRQAQTDGQIASIQQAAVDGCRLLLHVKGNKEEVRK